MKPSPCKSHVLPLDNIGQLFEERMEAERKAQADELTRILREPLENISHRAGDMERNSPLFHGTGDNPTLF